MYLGFVILGIMFIGIIIVGYVRVILNRTMNEFKLDNLEGDVEDW